MHETFVYRGEVLLNINQHQEITITFNIFQGFGHCEQQNAGFGGQWSDSAGQSLGNFMHFLNLSCKNGRMLLVKMGVVYLCVNVTTL